MSDQHYSNDKIDGMFLEIKGILKDQNKSLGRIEEQTTKHNGRMKKLEMWRFGLGMALGVVVVCVIPLLIYTFQTNNANLQKQIDNLQTK